MEIGKKYNCDFLNKQFHMFKYLKSDSRKRVTHEGRCSQLLQKGKVEFGCRGKNLIVQKKKKRKNEK